MPRTRENKPKQGSEDTQTEKENDSPGKYVKVRKPLLQLSKSKNILFITLYHETSEMIMKLDCLRDEMMLF